MGLVSIGLVFMALPDSGLPDSALLSSCFLAAGLALTGLPLEVCFGFASSGSISGPFWPQAVIRAANKAMLTNRDMDIVNNRDVALTDRSARRRIIGSVAVRRTAARTVVMQALRTTLA